MKEDTIAAIATPPGIGAISIIRISGPIAINVTDSIFEGKRRLAESDSHTLHYGNLKNLNGEIIDDVLISVFRAPNSYTCEDSTEINIHGNPLIGKLVLETLVKQGVRLAEPGEFTKRAFLNGRIDLSQAEAVADVIRSSADISLRGARNQLNGLLSKKINEIRTSLINLSSLVELELDFSEEDIQLVERNSLKEGINKLIEEINSLLNTYSFGRVVRDGVNIAIVGQPNVGKSSLLNYILKESRAIVSHIPGTTRDIIREEVSIDGILCRVFDTAGIRYSDDEIEREGVLRSREAIKNADIVLFLGDVEQGYSDELIEEIYNLNLSKNILKVINKTDLSSNPQLEFDVKVSAKTGIGMDDLLNKIKDASFENSNFSEKSAVVSNVRHYNCLSKAKAHLINVEESLEIKMSGEFISFGLRNAEQSLAEIIGLVTSDDILNNIFSNYCIGK